MAASRWPLSPLPKRTSVLSSMRAHVSSTDESQTKFHASLNTFQLSPLPTVELAVTSAERKVVTSAATSLSIRLHLKLPMCRLERVVHSAKRGNPLRCRRVRH